MNLRMESNNNLEALNELFTNEIIARWVRETTKQHLKNAVNVEVENLKDITQQTWKIATHNIIKQIKDSPEMATLIEIVKNNLADKVLTIENQQSLPEPSPTYRTTSQPAIPYSNEDGNWNQSNLDMIHPKHHQQLAEDISHNKALRTRINAFRILLNSQLSDAVSSDSWFQLQQNLQESLCDLNKEVFALSLKIHSKLTNSSSSSIVIKEGVFSLIEGLRSHYSRKYHKLIPDFEQGIDLRNPVHQRLIRISHLILETVKELPKGWVRFGERRVEEIMNVFLAMLTMHTYDSMYSKSLLYPFHILAALDPKASWCLQWLHGGFGRNLFFTIQPRVLTLLRYVLEEIYVYLKSPSVNRDLTNNKSDIIPTETIKYATFTHSIGILSVIVAFKKGHSIFPLSTKIQEAPLTLQEIFCTLVTYLNEKSSGYNVPIENIITDAVIVVLKHRQCPLLNDKSFIQLVLDPLESLTQDQSISPDQCTIPLHTIKILDVISESEFGVHMLLGSSVWQKRDVGKITAAASAKSQTLERQNSIKLAPEPLLTVNDFCPAKTIAQCTAFLLKSKNSYTDSLVMLTGICSKLYNHHNCFLILDAFSLPLIPMVVNTYKQLSSECDQDDYYAGTQVDPVNAQSQALLSGLTQLLAAIASVPLGLAALAQHQSLVADLTRSLLREPPVPWDQASFRQLTAQLATVPEGAVALGEESGRAVAQALCDLWAAHEDQDALLSGSDRFHTRATRIFLDIVFTVATTLAGAEALLCEHEGSEDTLLECGPAPITLVELLALANSTEPWHYVGLLTLRALLTNLDTWLYLENKLHIQKHLLQLQSDNVSNPCPLEESVSEETSQSYKDIIIDECSLLRHQILVSTFTHGGSSERKLPSVDIEIESVEEDGVPVLFRELPSVATYSPGSRSVRPRASSELQRLLQDTRGGLRDGNWLTRVRRVFRSARHEPVRAAAVQELAEQVAQCQPNQSTSGLHWPSETTVSPPSLCAEELLGVQATVRYGLQVHLLQPSSSNQELLEQLVWSTQSALGQFRNTPHFKGFDWFTASTFLLCGGSLERSRSFLTNMCAIPSAAWLWPALAEARGVSLHITEFRHLLDWVVAAELPLASTALQAAGVPWGLVCSSWLGQSFLDVLDWGESSKWLLLCILHPPDIALYLCVGLLRHLQPRILEASSEGRVWNQIKLEPFAGFRVGDQIPFIEKLTRRHRSVILPRLLESSKVSNT